MQSTVHGLIARLAVVAGLSFFPVRAQREPGPAAPDILSRVQKNVAAFQELLPDFICEELVTRQDIEQGKVTREDRYLSSFRVVRRKTAGSSTSPVFLETREVISATVKGKPATVRNYTPPIGVPGGFADDLSYFFDKAKEKCFDFEPVGRELIRGRAALILSIKVKDDVKRIGGKCSTLPPGKTSMAWVDSESLQIVRLQLSPVRYAEFNGPLSRWNGDYLIHQSIDYDQVSINGNPFWLPAAKQVEFAKLKGQRRILYVAGYSNFHKFDVTTAVRPIKK